MSPLSERAAELVRAGRQAGRPTEEDCERNLAALRARLGGVPVVTTWVPARRRAPRPFWPVAAVLVAGLGPGAALAIAMQKDRSLGPRPNIVESAPPAPKETVRTALPLPSVSVVESGTSSIAEPPFTSARRPGRDRLAEEVAILSRAAHYLEAGRASDALRAVDEHQRRVPNGMLTEERYAARVQALCALGRRDEATTELARLSRLAPDSPHVSRARQLCAAAAAGSAAPSGTR